MEIDVFHNDPFTAVELTAAVERNPYMPTGIGELNIFTPMPVRTLQVAVETRNGQLILIPFSPNGAPPTERLTEKRKQVILQLPRIAHGDTLKASEIASIRAFGQESELMQAQAEIGRRLSGPTGILNNIEYTWEYQRLAAIQGMLYDADGTLEYNYYDQFGITASAEIAFNLTARQKGGSLDDDGSLLALTNSVKRSVLRGAGGAITMSTRVVALCDDVFYDQFKSSTEYRNTFKNQPAAGELRQGTAFDQFDFGGISWINYRGSDDNTTVAIASGKCKFFPVNAPGVFQVAYGPIDTFDFVNTLGKPVYVMMIFDKDRNAWVRVEGYSHALYMCTRPDCLRSGRAAA